MHKNVEGNAQKGIFYLSVGLLQTYTAQWTDLYETLRRGVFLAKE